MRKKCAYLLVAALSVSMLAGCGSKTSQSKKTSKVEIELTDLLENATEATANIENLQMDLKGNLDAEMKFEGKKVSAKGDVAMSGKAVKEEPAFDMNGSVSYSATYSGTTLSGEYSANVCGETEDGMLNVYANLNKGDEKGDWYTDSVEASEITQAFADLEDSLKECKDAFSEISEDDWKIVESILKLEDMTQIVNNRECYVINMVINKESIMELIKTGTEYADEEELEEALQEAEEAFESISLDCRGQICYDKETFLPVKYTISFTMEGDVEETWVNIKNLSLEMNMFVNEQVKIDGVSDSVKEEAIKTDMNLSDMIEMDDEHDEYDWDDEDIDWDDEDIDWDEEDIDGDDEEEPVTGEEGYASDNLSA